MKVYFDCCSLGRLTDNQAQDRVRAESDAVENILGFISVGRIEWVSSSALEMEILENPDDKRKLQGKALLDRTTSKVEPDGQTTARAKYLISLGYGPTDALHLACAEHASVDVLLTTDDRFLRRAQRLTGNPTVRVANPVDWWNEVESWLRKR